MGYFPIPTEPSLENIENYLNYIIQPGQTYHLVVNHDLDSVIAPTTVPNEMNITPYDMWDYECPDGTILPTSTIDVNNLENLSFEQLITLAQSPDTFISEKIPFSNQDEIYFWEVFGKYETILYKDIWEARNEYMKTREKMTLIPMMRLKQKKF